MVRDLLVGYVPGRWLEDADFSTLAHVNGSYVSKSERQRHDDQVWRLKIGGRWLWVYIVLEFQSGSDPWMAVRMMEYVSLLAGQIVRENRKSELPEGRIPPILPIVLYNGLPGWSAELDVADCFIEPPGGLEAYQPRLRYLLLDERRLRSAPEGEVRNFADAVFRMEANHGKDEVFAVIRALAEVLRAPERKPLRDAFHVWTTRLLQRHTRDTRIIETIGGINDIFEEYVMAEAIYEDWGVAAERKGFQRGEAKGKATGEANMLVRLLTRRFGPLPQWAETRVRRAQSAQLEAWSDLVLDAPNLTEVLGAPDRQ
jgi:predicted transposase YdaD